MTTTKAKTNTKMGISSYGMGSHQAFPNVPHFLTLMWQKNTDVEFSNKYGFDLSSEEENKNKSKTFQENNNNDKDNDKGKDKHRIYKIKN